MMNQIQLFKPLVSEEAIASVAEVLRSGWMGLGPKTAEFERCFAEYIGAKYAVGLNSSTSALHLAMLIHNIGPGDEVLTTSFTFVSTNHAIKYVGAIPVFVDIDAETLNLDLRKAAKLVTPKTKAIVAVHYGGNPVDIDELYAFAKKHGLAVIEDAAHACGSTYRNVKIGSRGTTCFSFHAVKNLPTGDGGMITTNSQAHYEKLMRLRWLGIDRSTFARSTNNSYAWEYGVEDIGFKYHMNDIVAAIGIEHLKKVEEWNGRRAAIAKAYRSYFEENHSDSVKLIKSTPNSSSSNHIFVIRLAERDKVVDALAKMGVSVGVHYKPNHFFECYRNLTSILPVTEKAFREVISLPMHLFLSDADVDYVCQSVTAALKKPIPIQEL